MLLYYVFLLLLKYALSSKENPTLKNGDRAQAPQFVNVVLQFNLMDNVHFFNLLQKLDTM